jgi:mono/diheme cytochrome c family protein
LKPRLVKILAVIGAIAVVMGLAGGVFAIALIRRGFGARPAPSGLEERLALSVRSLAMPARYARMKNPVKVDAPVLEGAMEHWADHCAGCHGNDGSGHTTMGQNMNPRPPDMRGARTQQLSDGQLYYVINQGVRLTGMPAWGQSGDGDLASWELVAFIRTLPSLTPAQLDRMKAMNPMPASAVKQRQEEDDFLNDEKPHEHKGH